MSETGPEPSGAGARPGLTLTALPAEALPPAVQKLAAAPTPMKLMAAKGIAPLRPGDLLIAIYQLSFEADAAVKAAAEGAPAALPDKIVAPALGEALPPQVLHFFASKLAPTRTEALEKLLYNVAAADETVVVLAGRVGERELEIIFQNEARILRCPGILEALYGNREARMSSVNRAIELCARNGVRVEGIPGFDEVVKSISDDRSATDPAAADGAFAGLLAATEKATPEPEPPARDAPAAPAPGEAPGGERRSATIDFARLKLHEKIRLATLGNEYCRANLVRDPNRVVAMAAIRSPRITDAEISRASANRTVCEDVIRYIANQRELTKHYQVKLNLVQNPKTPLGLSLRLLNLLNAEDIKDLARSKNVPSALSTAARRLMQTRKGGQG
jgi:hypothetical protein